MSSRPNASASRPSSHRSRPLPRSSPCTRRRSSAIYLADIGRLAEVAAGAAKLDEPELVATLRQLVQAVIVHAPPGTDEFAIEIKASLSELTLPGPLLKRSSGG
jgi:hypothetical protein